MRLMPVCLLRARNEPGFTGARHALDGMRAAGLAGERTKCNSARDCGSYVRQKRMLVGRINYSYMYFGW